MFSTNRNNKNQTSAAKDSWLSGSTAKSSSDGVAPKSKWSTSLVPSGSKSVTAFEPSAKLVPYGKAAQTSGSGKHTSTSQSSSASSSSSWEERTIAQQSSSFSNGSTSKTFASSLSSSYQSHSTNASSSSTSSTRHEFTIPSSINKNVMDKATNLLTYKSPDRIGLTGHTGIAASKYLINKNASAVAYKPVYSRTPGGYSSAVVGTGALATAAVLYPALSGGPDTTSPPTLSIAKLNNEVPKPMPSIKEKSKPFLTQQDQSSLSSSSRGLKPSLNKPTISEPHKTPTTPSPINSSNRYTRLKAKEGFLMIFNQQNFKIPGVEPRLGSQMDEEALCRTFYEFGFKPIVKRDLRLKEIEKAAEELKRKDFKKYECVVIVVLSHGHINQTIYAADGHFNLQDMFVNRVAMNETLRGKAKIFIVAACKGDSEVTGIRMQTDATPLSRPTINKLPYMRDTLQCFSTYEGFVSYRDTQRGTVFVQELCRVLKEEGESTHIEDILKHVNVALTERPTHQQVPTVTSTMSFNLFFSQLKH